MLHILICEDDIKYRTHIQTIVSEYISANNNDIELALTTGRPMELLEYLEKYPNQSRLYFLDVDLQHDINGINLGQRIRQVEPAAKIVFVTTHTEMSYLVFVHKIEAMDYVAKDNPKGIEKRIAECIHVAYKQYIDEKNAIRKQEYFNVKVGGKAWNIPYDDIMFFETHLTMKHKLILNTKDSQLEFRTPISDVADIGSDFFRCHKSYVVNIKNIRYVDKKKGEIVMMNDTVVPIAAKKITELVKAMEQDR